MLADLHSYPHPPSPAAADTMIPIITRWRDHHPLHLNHLPSIVAAPVHSIRSRAEPESFVAAPVGHHKEKTDVRALPRPIYSVHIILSNCNHESTGPRRKHGSGVMGSALCGYMWGAMFACACVRVRACAACVRACALHGLQGTNVQQRGGSHIWCWLSLHASRDQVVCTCVCELQLRSTTWQGVGPSCCHCGRASRAASHQGIRRKRTAAPALRTIPQ